MIRHIGDIAFSLLLCTGSIYLWFVADTFPRFAKYRYVDSNFWPKILLALTCALSLGLLIQNLFALRKYMAQNTGRDKSDPTPGRPGEVDWRMFILMSLLCLAYFAGLQILGFLISTILFLWFSIVLISTSNRWLKHLFPVIFTACIMVLFVKVLELSLPRGVWLFRDFSLLFY
jgi:hypothetical protein